MSSIYKSRILLSKVRDLSFPGERDCNVKHEISAVAANSTLKTLWYQIDFVLHLSTNSMKQKIRTLALTIYLFIGILIPSCDWINTVDDCDCSGSRYFDVEGLQVDAFTDIDQGILVTPAQQLRLSEFDGFYVDYLVDYHACLTPKADFSLSLMNSAFACSCLPGFDGSNTEELLDFTITTINDFDADHLAGSNIIDLFQYQGGFFEPDDQPLADFLVQEQSGKLTIEDMRLRLLEAPSLDSVLQIKVRMELSTGEVYEELSPAFVLLP